MGKEAKIGLAVVGVLLSVFGVLLFRHFSITKPASVWKDDHRTPAAPLAAKPPADKPNVVVAQDSAATAGRPGALWGAGSSQSGSGDPPSASYMPAGETDIATDQPPPAAAALAADHEAANSPFQNGSGAVEGNEPPPPVELPRQDATGQARRNPLRRLSAELPLEVPQIDRAAPADAPSSEPGDPYADQPSPPDNYAEPLENTPSAEPAPEQPVEQPIEQPVEESVETAPSEPPSAGNPAGAADDPFPDAFGDQPSRTPAAETPAEPAPRAVPQQPLRTETVMPQAAVPREQLPLDNGMYVVQPNDTLWSISEKVYGTGGYFKALAALNRANLPRSDQLTVGARVAVPPADELEQKYPSLVPRQRRSALVSPRPAATVPARTAGADGVYVVEEGDTLFDIARYELGKASRWAEIYELNRDQLGEDFDYLRPGLELRLPARTGAAETIGRRGAASDFR